jgi:Flp pilus assembly protein TadB
MSDAHERLMKIVHEYYKLNQHWQAKETHTAGIKIRQLLSELRQVARDRRKEIQDVRITKPKIKSPKYQQSLLQAKEKNNDKQ